MKKKKYLFFVFSVVLATALKAQISFSGKAIKVSPTDYIEHPLQAHLIQVMNEEDMKAKAQWKSQLNGIAIVGKALPCSLSFRTDATLYRSMGKRIYRLWIKSPKAKAISVAYKRFDIPQGAKFYVLDGSGNTLLGAYKKESNPRGGTFMTDIVEGEECVLQYEAVGGEIPQIELDHIAYIFSSDYKRTPFQIQNTGVRISPNEWVSGFCQVNVNCSEGDDWKDAARSVVQIYEKIGDNYALCTGTLLNNTKKDFTPYIVTAGHCAMNGVKEIDKDDFNYWLFRFNFKRPSCENNITVKPYAFTLTGAECCSFLSIISKSDGLLLKLKQDIPSYYGVYFNGWDRSDIKQQEIQVKSSVGLHHPSGDVMKIATYKEAPQWATWNEISIDGSTSFGEEKAHWAVRASRTPNGHSVTEPGSSGSGLFDATTKKLIGTLSGGVPQCDRHINGKIYYGRLSYHWDRFKKSDDKRSSMDIFLDPIGNGKAYSLDGVYRPGDCLLASPEAFQLEKIENGKAHLVWKNPKDFPKEAKLLLVVNGKKIHLNTSETSYQLDLKDFKGAIELQLASVIGDVMALPESLVLYTKQAQLSIKPNLFIDKKGDKSNFLQWEKPRQLQLIGPCNFKNELPYIAHEFSYVDGKSLNYNRLYFGEIWNGRQFASMGDTYVVGVRAIAAKSPGLCDYALFLRNGIKTYQNKEGDYLLDSLAAPYCYRERVFPKKGSSKAERLSWQTYFLEKPFLINPSYQLVGAWEMTSKNKFSMDVIAMAPEEKEGSDYGNVFSFDGLRWLSSSEQSIAKGVKNRAMAFQLILSNTPNKLSNIDENALAYSPNPIQWSKIVALELYRDGKFLVSLDKEQDSYTDNSVIGEHNYELRYIYEDNSQVMHQEKVKILPQPKVYPTQVKDFLHIQETKGVKSIRLFDLNGCLLQERGKECPSIDMSQYPVGIYFVEIEMKDSSIKHFKIQRIS